MKKTLHNMNVFRILALCLSLCLALSALTLPALAASETTAADTEWVVSDDGETITGDGATLHRYEFPAGYAYSLVKGVRYEYAPYVVYQGDYYTAFTPYYGPGADDPELDEHWEEIEVVPPDAADVRLLYLDSAVGDILFVTDDLRIELDALRDGRGAAYHFCRGDAEWADSKFADLPTDEASYRKMLTSGKSVSIPASELTGHLDSEVLLFDSTDFVSCAVGAVFTLDSGVFLVDFAALPANCFDAEGHLSYRAGDVQGVMLDPDVEAGYTSAEWSRWNWLIVSHPFQLDERSEKDITVALVLFWIFFVFNGFLLPVVPLVLGLVFANKKKWGKPRRWYLLSILAAVWILIALIIMIVIL